MMVEVEFQSAKLPTTLDAALAVRACVTTDGRCVELTLSREVRCVAVMTPCEARYLAILLHQAASRAELHGTTAAACGKRG